MHQSLPLYFAARRWLLVGLALMAAVAFAATAASRSLWSPDEGRYAEIGREMLATGDWITPRLNAVRYFEKPPLVYWAISTAFALFGLGEAAARLPMVLSGLGLLALTVWLGRMTCSTRAGWLAAGMLAACPMVFTLAQVVVLDMPLAALFTAALCCSWRGFAGFDAGQATWRRWPVAASALLALATLAKGPIAVLLAALVLLPALLAPSRRAVLHSAPWGWMLVVYLSITVPWFLAVSREHPEFLRFFFVHEHLDRYLTPGHARPGGPLYFVPVLILGFFPWSLLLSACAVQPPRLAPGARFFLACWILLPVVFFSLSRSKLPPYVLPVFPALAVWLAGTLSALLEAPAGPRVRCVLSAGSALVAAVLLAVMVKAWRLDVMYYHDLAAIRWPALVPLAVCTLLALASTAALSRGRVRFGLELLLAMTLVGLTGATQVAPFYEPMKDSRVLAREILARRRPGERVAVYGTLESSSALPFYLREPVVVAGHHFGELDMAHDAPEGDEASRFLDPTGIQKWMFPGQPRAWFVTQQSVYDEYFAPHPMFRLSVVRRHGNRLLFTNP